MTRYSAIIADDEENLCKHLKSLLENLWPDLEVIGIGYSGPEALSLIKQEEPDIAFLDIKMPVMSGINVAMHTHGLCHVVFITAYDEFAIQAFEQEAIDYIQKPVTEERLNKTILKLQDSLSLQRQKQDGWYQLLNKLTSDLKNPGTTHYLKWLRVGKADKTILIHVDEVIYFRASDKYTSVITPNGEHLIRKTIKDLNTELDPNHHWQINRGLIVNVNCISSTKREINGRCKIYLKNNNEVLMASRKYSHLFKQM